ncbi:MAG: hypothetical protein ACO3UU_05020 [Minisyncoccia bacterium]
MENFIMGIDQYGDTYHDLSKYPRKKLQDIFDTKKIEKMYIDNDEGQAIHIGYIIKGYWIRLYKVQPLNN